MKSPADRVIRVDDMSPIDPSGQDFVLFDFAVVRRRVVKRLVGPRRELRGQEAARGSFGARKGNTVKATA